MGQANNNQAVEVRRFGDADGLEVVSAPLPEARRGEVRIRLLASGIEYTDVVIRRHLYAQTMFLRPPFVMGYDVVGEIDQLGPGVSGFRIGDRVADLTVVGSNARYRTLKASDLVRVPSGVDAAEAAALILSWTTAYQLLHRSARVQRGQRVLVHGAAGAVGQALLALGRMAGVEMWGTARGERAGVEPAGRDLVPAVECVFGALAHKLAPGRQAAAHVLDQFDARATSGMVQRRLGTPLRHARIGRDPAARGRAHFV